MPGTTGWEDTFGGWNVVEWGQEAPVINMAGSGLGVQNNQFTFTVTWVPNASVIVQACTNLAAPVWPPVSTNMLTDGVLNFSDNQSADMPQRFYRVFSE